MCGQFAQVTMVVSNVLVWDESTGRGNFICCSGRSARVWLY